MTWKLNTTHDNTADPVNIVFSFHMFDLNNIPNNFMSYYDIVRCIIDAVANIEGSLLTQSAIHVLSFAIMLDTIPYKAIINEFNNKRLMPVQLCWTKKLSDVWPNVCLVER